MKLLNFENKVVKYSSFFLLSLFLVSNCSAQDKFFNNVKIEPKFFSVEISWEAKTLSEIEDVILLRKENKPPESIADGEEIYRGNGNKFTDETAEKNKNYYYGLALVDSLGNVSSIFVSEAVGLIGFWPFMGKLITENYILVIGPLVIIFLAFVDYFTRKRSIKKYSEG